MRYGLKQTTIPLDRISSVTCQTDVVFGKIIITAGNSERKITNVWKKTVLLFTNKLQ